MAATRLCGGRSAKKFLSAASLPQPKLSATHRPFTLTHPKTAKLRTKYSGPTAPALPEYPHLSPSEEPKPDTYKTLEVHEVTTLHGPNLEPIVPYPNNDLSSTRPAPLKLPESPQAYDFEAGIPMSVRAKYLYRLGRAYVGFYWTGLKKIRSNHNECREIRARLSPVPVHIAAQYGGAKDIPILSRREYLLNLRTRHDVLKLLPFGLILCIFGEFTPLVILAIGSSVVPYTCRIPRQIKHDRDKFRKRFLTWRAPGPDDLVLTEALKSERYTQLAYLHGISPTPKVWPLIGPFLYDKFYRPALRRQLREILLNAILTHREGGIARLEPEEVIEYGLSLKSAISAALIDAMESGEYDASPQVRQQLREAMQKDLDNKIQVVMDEAAESATKLKEAKKLAA